MEMKPLAVTTGEPAGIGPEVSLRGALESDDRIELIGDENLLRETAGKLGVPYPLPPRITVRHVPLAARTVPGKLDVRNAPYVVETLAEAADGAMSGRYRAVVTAPVQKSIITESGLPFTGHTEFFADRAGVRRVVMMLMSGVERSALRVALVTTHLALREVPDAITAERISEVTSILQTSLERDFRIGSPKIAVTGLNPHAGENGHMGTEELEIIGPEIEREKALGLGVSGPYPADTIFTPDHIRQFDAFLCMYHDQGLPVLKHVGFGHGINVTLGLPYVRTSVDHGTALDIAGRGVADTGSMTAALELARELSENRSRYGRQA